MFPLHSKMFVDSNEAPPLRPFLEKIIDKKVDNIALTIFESIIDFFCTYCYSAYQQRFEYRMSDLNFDNHDEVDEANEAEDSPAQTVAKKVLHFMDGAPLYDRTHSQRIKIERPKLFNIITEEHTEGEDQILIDGKPVYFIPDPTKRLLFGKNFGTEAVFVTDVKECPELVIIYERETTKNLKAWCVDTSQPTKKVTMGGQLSLFDQDIFMAQEIAPLAPPSPLVESFV